MDGLTPTTTDDAVEALLPPHLRGETASVGLQTPARWNLAHELARRRNLAKPGGSSAAVASMRSAAGSGRTRSQTLSSVSDDWLLPPMWPLDGWFGSVAVRWRKRAEIRIVALARLSTWPRRPRVQQYGLMSGVTLSVVVAAALFWSRTDASSTPTRSSSTAEATAAGPLRVSGGIKPSLSASAPVPLALAPHDTPTVLPPATRIRAITVHPLPINVSTMDLMMPMAEPDLDITSDQSLWVQVGKSTGVDPLLLYSIALVESKSLNSKGEVTPTPWLFRINNRVVRGDRHEVQLAMAAATQFGAPVQDVGIMQVYYPVHRNAVRDPLVLLNPRTNITLAAKILLAGMKQTRDPVLGVGYYHSHTPTLARNYGTLVLSVYERVKAIYRPAADEKIAEG